MRFPFSGVVDFVLNGVGSVAKVFSGGLWLPKAGTGIKFSDGTTQTTASSGTGTSVTSDSVITDGNIVVGSGGVRKVADGGIVASNLVDKGQLPDKGMILVSQGAGNVAALAVGANGKVLQADDMQSFGVKWGDGPAAGDVFGPAGGVADGDLPVFANATGKLLKKVTGALSLPGDFSYAGHKPAQTMIFPYLILPTSGWITYAPADGGYQWMNAKTNLSGIFTTPLKVGDVVVGLGIIGTLFGDWGDIGDHRSSSLVSVTLWWGRHSSIDGFSGGVVYTMTGLPLTSKVSLTFNVKQTLTTPYTVLSDGFLFVNVVCTTSNPGGVYIPHVTLEVNRK